MPHELAAREQLIDDLFRWREEASLPPTEPRQLGLRLTRNAEVVIDMSDGSPIDLRLKITPSQCEELRQFLVSAALPSDLYFPEDELIKVVEPRAYLGGVVLCARQYTPRQFRQRSLESYPDLTVPSDDDRRVHFAQVCDAGLRFVTTHLERDELDPQAVVVDLEVLRTLEDQLRRCRDLTLRLLPTGDIRRVQLPPFTAAANLRSSLATGAAYRRLMRAALLRLAELREPGRPIDSEETREVEKLQMLAMQAMMEADRSAPATELHGTG